MSVLQNVVQIISYGVINGAVYGLAALGLSLVYGIMKYLNIAHGAIIILGSYVTFWIFKLFGIDPFVSIPLSMLFLFLLGLIIYKLLLNSFVKLPEGERIKMSLLVTFGLLVVLPNAITIIWTGDTRAVSTTYTGLAFDIGGVRIPYTGIAMVVLAVIVIFALHIFLNKTYFGKSIRAVSEDQEAAALMGINVSRTYLIAFAIGLALAAVAGARIAMRGVSPPVSLEWTNKALVVVVLAGMGSINGVFVGGLLLGVIEAIAVLFLGSVYRDVVGLILFVLVLLFMPNGLLGAKTRNA